MQSRLHRAPEFEQGFEVRVLGDGLRKTFSIHTPQCQVSIHMNTELLFTTQVHEH